MPSMRARPRRLRCSRPIACCSWPRQDRENPATMPFVMGGPAGAHHRECASLCHRRACLVRHRSAPKAFAVMRGFVGPRGQRERIASGIRNAQTPCCAQAGDAPRRRWGRWGPHALLPMHALMGPPALPQPAGRAHQGRAWASPAWMTSAITAPIATIRSARLVRAQARHAVMASSAARTLHATWTAVCADRNRVWGSHAPWEPSDPVCAPTGCPAEMGSAGRPRSRRSLALRDRTGCRCAETDLGAISAMTGRPSVRCGEARARRAPTPRCADLVCSVTFPCFNAHRSAAWDSPAETTCSAGRTGHACPPIRAWSRRACRSQALGRPASCAAPRV